LIQYPARISFQTLAMVNLLKMISIGFIAGTTAGLGWNLLL